MPHKGKIFIALLGFVIIFSYVGIKLLGGKNEANISNNSSNTSNISNDVIKDSSDDVASAEASADKQLPVATSGSSEVEEADKEVITTSTPREQAGAKVVVKDEPPPVKVADPNVKIRIIKKSGGEEPDWIQKAWIGLEIPVLLGSYKQKGGQEVLSKEFRARDNYVVPLEVALSILKEKDPKAEKWWRDNVDLTGVFGIGFDRDACELIEE